MSYIYYIYYINHHHYPVLPIHLPFNQPLSMDNPGIFPPGLLGLLRSLRPSWGGPGTAWRSRHRQRRDVPIVEGGATERGQLQA